ncbi:hypothetical protein [Listeria aquatica]|uniref:hypothetical protein n=1 Tax=Listeria aquatica TaxID=1494960 RepID=UPI0031F4FDD6
MKLEEVDYQGESLSSSYGMNLTQWFVWNVGTYREKSCKIIRQREKVSLMGYANSCNIPHENFAVESLRKNTCFKVNFEKRLNEMNIKVLDKTLVSREIYNGIDHFKTLIMIVRRE